MESYPPLWQDLEFTNNMSAAALTAWFERAERNDFNLRSARIISCDFSYHFRNQIKRIQRRPKLERIELDVASQEANILSMLPDPSQYLKTLIVSAGSWVPISTVKQIMTNYPHLEHVEFHRVFNSNTQCSWPEMPNLRSVVLQVSALRNRQISLPNWQDLEWVSPISPHFKSKI
jgi:hypothetical protein